MQDEKFKPIRKGDLVIPVIPEESNPFDPSDIYTHGFRLGEVIKGTSVTYGWIKVLCIVQTGEYFSKKYPTTYHVNNFIKIKFKRYKLKTKKNINNDQCAAGEFKIKAV